MLRPCPFEQNHIENFDSIETFALGLKELATLFDGGPYHCIFVASERNLWPVRLEQVLIDMKTGTECLECRFQPFYRILLFGAV